jgi:hypothetical protein
MTEIVERGAQALLARALTDRGAWDDTERGTWDDLLLESVVLDGVVLEINGAPAILASVVLREAASVIREIYKEGPPAELSEEQRLGWMRGMANAYKIVRGSVLLTPAEGDET